MAIYGELDSVIFVENISRLKVPFGKIVIGSLFFHVFNL